jgi:NTP pyrophosphatase (non-canonical NTP hydrolase)
MTIKEYQEQAKRTLPKLGSRWDDNIHMVLGMQTEAAELADAFKKRLAYGKNLDEVNIKEEVGDQMWYIANLCNINGWDLGEILETNINKLRVRYPEKFTQENALVRDLNAERKELEK